MGRKHVQADCFNPEYCGGTCEGCTHGVCSVCMLIEGALTTHCPGVNSYMKWGEKVYKEGWDFKDGQWFQHEASDKRFPAEPEFEETEDTDEAEIRFTQRKEPVLTQVRFHTDPKLYAKFTNRVKIEGLFIQDVFTDFMHWFVDQPKIKKEQRNAQAITRNSRSVK